MCPSTWQECYDVLGTSSFTFYGGCSVENCFRNGNTCSNIPIYGADYKCCIDDNYDVNSFTTSPPQYTGGGTGESYFLDRVEVRCNAGSVLNGFLFKRDLTDKDKYYYYYKCKQVIGTSTPLISYTNYGLIGPHGRVIYLDRIPVKCPTDTQLLSYFHLESNHQSAPHGTFGDQRYKFECVVPTLSVDPQSCLDYQTEPGPNGQPTEQGGLVYLDRLGVFCGHNQGLQSFQLINMNDIDMIYYSYRCCNFKY